MSVEKFLGLYNYWIVVFLMMTGFYIVIARGNLIKKIIGLNIFQTSVFLLYITMGKIQGATAPIIPPHLVPEHGAHTTETHGALPEPTKLEQAMSAGEIQFSNPLPSVLMLTAIVVGIATTALALALIVRIREEYGSVEEDEILATDRNTP